MSFGRQFEIGSHFAKSRLYRGDLRSNKRFAAGHQTNRGPVEGFSADHSEIEAIGLHAKARDPTKKANACNPALIFSKNSKIGQSWKTI